MKLFIKGLSILLLLFLLVGSLVCCGSNKEEKIEKNEFSSLADIEEATIGIITGANTDLIAQEAFPKAERKYFSSVTDVLIALQQGKVDTFFCDKPVYTAMKWENSDITCIDERVEKISNALILPKEGYDEALLDKINEFIAKSKENGTLEGLSKKWFGDSAPTQHPDYHSLTGENGTLKIAVSDSMKPSVYRMGEDFTGYEIDFLTLFAKEYGYKLDIEGMSLDAILSSVISGKRDIGACGLTITPERAKNITFSDSHFETDVVAVIRNTAEPVKAYEFNSFEDMNGEKVGMLGGTLWDVVAKEEIPGATINHFSTTADLLLALDQGKISGAIGPKTFYVTARWEDIPVRVLDDTEASFSSAFMMAKEGYNQNLLNQLNEFIGKAREDGTLDKLVEKWFSDEEPTEHPNYQSLSGENGTLKIAVDNTTKPLVYQKNDLLTGFDVEVLTIFAKNYGYAVEFEPMSFATLINYVSSGKCDMGACGVAITPERAESVTFTDSYFTLEGMLMVSEDAPIVTEENSFFDKISESFRKTFIREGRWKLILEGVGVTMIISLCAALLGTLIGFGLYLLSRSSVKAVSLMVKGFSRVYSRIIAGTPVIVILMIFFYVIFGSVRDMSGIVVAIIAFALVFGAFVYEHLTVSVDNVDPGQTEAAFSLGYTKNKTFFRIIFPQAMRIFMPAYCSHAVELIKATAVVGYIAVNDLTKMGDIIRSNTYEAFFPLIAIAVIYFFLTWILASLLGLLRKRFEPKRRSGKSVLKGVRTNDKD